MIKWNESIQKNITQRRETMSIKKGSAPPRYDEEFKKEAMALVTEKGTGS